MLILLLRIASDQAVMKRYKVAGALRLIGWLAAIVVSMASVGYILFQLLA